MDGIVGDTSAELASEGAGDGVCGIGMSNQVSESFDGAKSLEDTDDHGAGGAEGNERLEIGASGMLLVKGAGQIGAEGQHAKSHDGKSVLFADGKDVSDTVLVNSVGFDHGKGLFHKRLQGA